MFLNPCHLRLFYTSLQHYPNHEIFSPNAVCFCYHCCQSCYQRLHCCRGARTWPEVASAHARPVGGASEPARVARRPVHCWQCPVVRSGVYRRDPTAVPRVRSSLSTCFCEVPLWKKKHRTVQGIFYWVFSNFVISWESLWQVDARS